MARVRSFEHLIGDVRVHPTEADCSYKILRGPQPMLQISSYGSDERVSRPKVSQTLQFNREMATRLMAALHDAFPGI